MQVSKKEGRVLAKAIKHWQESDVITEPESQKLQSAYEVISFDWQGLAKYSFWMAIACIVISLSAVTADKWLAELFQRIVNAPDSIKCAIFATVAGGFYFLGVRRKKQSPGNLYSNEAIIFLGVLSTAAAIGFLGKAIDTGSGHFSLLFLLATGVYAALGLWFPSQLVWLFALLSLGSWFGAETGYASGWGAYFLGMNYPLRFVLFGLVLVVCGSYLFRHWNARSEFLRSTRAVGLLYLFIALWIMSIFGNYGDQESWQRAGRAELFLWALLFAGAAIAAIYHGLKYDDGMTRGFGLTFLFINLYTKFFEFFWNDLHKAVFFALLALSFWFLGSRAEKIWQLNFLKSSKDEKSQTPITP